MLAGVMTLSQSKWGGVRALGKNVIRGAAYGLALAAAAGFGQTNVTLRQPFDSLDALTVAATRGATNLTASACSEDAAPGNRHCRLRWHSLRDNGIVQLTWAFPPTDMTGRKFLLWLKPVTPLPYFTVNVMDASGRRIERHTWYGLPAGGWRALKWWSGVKTFDNSFESSDAADRTRAARIVFCPGGGEGLDCEIALGPLEEEPDLLGWLIRERPNRGGEGVRE